MEPQSPSSTHRGCLTDVWQGARYYLFLWGKEASDSCRSADTPLLGSKLRPLLLSSFLYAKRSGPDHGWMDVLVLSGTCLG